MVDIEFPDGLPAIGRHVLIFQKTERGEGSELIFCCRCICFTDGRRIPAAFGWACTFCGMVRMAGIQSRKRTRIRRLVPRPSERNRRRTPQHRLNSAPFPVARLDLAGCFFLERLKIFQRHIVKIRKRPAVPPCHVSARRQQCGIKPRRCFQTAFYSCMGRKTSCSVFKSTTSNSSRSSGIGKPDIRTITKGRLKPLKVFRRPLSIPQIYIRNQMS